MSSKRGRRRIIAGRIIEVLKESTGPMSPKGIKDALEAKGYRHAYEPIMRNISYLKSKRIISLWTDNKWFLLSTDNKRAYAQRSYQLMIKRVFGLIYKRTMLPVSINWRRSVSMIGQNHPRINAS